MMKSKFNNCRLVLSGPGSGKTTGMIDEVAKELPTLKPNKYIVVITYTNAATEDIKSKFSKRIQIPPNLFIGTIHSFLNRFIVIPYASLFGIIPYEVCFIDEIVVTDTRFLNYATKKARDKGVISYDQIEWIAEKIVCGGVVKKDSTEIKITKRLSDLTAEAISNRLQSIFVDEYQDATLIQHRILKRIVVTGNCKYFYCVGDSEQYIYGFAYSRKQKHAPKFSMIPIKELEKMKDISKNIKTVNYRSSATIVEFLNRFSPINQVAVNASSMQSLPVFFVNETNTDNIVNKFQTLCRQYGLKNVKKFHLAHYGTTLNCNAANGYCKGTNNIIRKELILAEILRYISSVSGISQQKLCELNKFDQLELRKIGCYILKIIRKQPDITCDKINAAICHILKVKISKEYSGEDVIEKIKNSFVEDGYTSTNYFTTIHKAKGLEAEAVLVVAETQKKFTKWLEINRSVRDDDNTDQCRLGFVAFSRAKQLLCIACLENVGFLKTRLKEFGIEIAQ